MTAATISVTEDQLFTQLRAFILGLVSDGTNPEVVRGLDNRVPMPLGPFILVTSAGLVPLAQPTSKYGGMLQTLDVSTPMQWTVGVDCYGPNAQAWATILSTVLRTPYGCDQLIGLVPLYAGDASQFPLIDGEQQFEERWRFDAVLHYTPVVSLAQQSAIALVLNVLSVDPTYPPGV